MERLVVTLTRARDGSWVLYAGHSEGGGKLEPMLVEESSPCPHLSVTDVWPTAQQMVEDRLVALEPPTLWEQARE